MKPVAVTLLTTEVLDGRKRRPGDTVALPADHPVAVKTAAMDAGRVVPVEPSKPERKNAGRD